MMPHTTPMTITVNPNDPEGTALTLVMNTIPVLQRIVDAMPTQGRKQQFWTSFFAALAGCVGATVGHEGAAATIRTTVESMQSLLPAVEQRAAPRLPPAEAAQALTLRMLTELKVITDGLETDEQRKDFWFSLLATLAGFTAGSISGDQAKEVVRAVLAELESRPPGSLPAAGSTLQ